MNANEIFDPIRKGMRQSPTTIGQSVPVDPALTTARQTA